MDTPGITVRDIPSMIGDGDIHEVFFDDVEVPETRDARRRRPGLEHRARGAGAGARRHSALRAGVAHARSRGGYIERADRFAAAACVQAARARAACEVARLYSYRIVDQRRHGAQTGPEASAARVATVSCERLVAEFVVEHCPEALAGGDPMLLAHHQRAIVAGIASGAAEIQLNLVATELLGLPREPR